MAEGNGSYDYFSQNGAPQAQPLFPAGGNEDFGGGGGDFSDHHPPAQQQQRNRNPNQQQMKDASLFVRLRGLPYAANTDDVKKFFKDITMAGVYFTQGWDGRPTGECYVEVENMTDVARALTFHRETMQTPGAGKARYVEVFEVGQPELNRFWSRYGNQASSDDGTVVRLRGLPFGSTEDDVIKFLQGLEIMEHGIIFDMDPVSLRPTGEAYVRFIDSDTSEKAFSKHLQTMGHRYIEVFRSTLAEFNRANPDSQESEEPEQTGPRSLLDLPPLRPPPGWSAGGMGPPPHRGWDDDDYYDEGPPGPYGGAPWDDWRRGGPGPMGPRMPHSPRFSGPYGGGNGSPGQSRMNKRKLPEQPSGVRIRMRGLPFKATYDDIMKFFSPLTTVDVSIQYNDNGQPSGEAFVDFDSVQTAQDAMSRDGQNIGQRWIELFMDDGPSPISNKKSFGGSYFPSGPAPAPKPENRGTAWAAQGLNAKGQVQYPSIYGGASGGQSSNPMMGGASGGQSSMPMMGGASGGQPSMQLMGGSSGGQSSMPLMGGSSGGQSSNPSMVGSGPQPDHSGANFGGEESAAKQQQYEYWQKYQQYWQQYQQYQQYYQQQQLRGASGGNYGPPPPPPPRR